MQVSQYKGFIFSLDNIFPSKDYDIQVFYLFGQFMEFTFPHVHEGKRITNFMILKYPIMTREELINVTIEHFNISDEYKENFNRLYSMARLPVKLIMFPEIESQMKELQSSGKQLFIIADGDIAEQVNKIKQLEWNGLEQSIRIYFSQELGGKDEAIRRIAEESGLEEKEIFIK